MTETERKMGEAPIAPMLAKNSVPMMLSLLFNSLYNVVDSIFVSRIEEDALTALSLCSPIQIVCGALGLGLAVGLNSAISKALGEKDREKVKTTASAAMFLGFCAYAIILLLLAFLMKPYLRWQSGGNEAIYNYGVDYMRIILLFSLPNMFQWIFDRFVIATGKNGWFLVTLTAASLTNLILDPVFIFGYFGVPAMGTTGAAIATVIGQTLGAVTGYIVNRLVNTEIPVSFAVRPDGECIKQILKVGIPAALVRGVTACVATAMNTILIEFSSTAVAVMGICSKIQGLATIPPHGIDNSLIPIMAYNYGARNRRRIDESRKWALIYSFGMMAIIALALELFPGAVLRLFDASENMLEIGIPAIRILAASWFISVFCMISATEYQALGQGSCSMYLTTAQQAILPMLLALLLERTGVIDLFWCAYLFAELLSIPIALCFNKKVRCDILDKIGT